ncbi:hypothetical protein [Chryseobacterium sp.]|uniref:hypothetical protein n=1 Tax=Chryseobacterium sp. TaxID=1871047 RepID=UPI002FCA6195
MAEPEYINNKSCEAKKDIKTILNCDNCLDSTTVYDDADLQKSENKSIADHNDNYTQILNTFVKHTKFNVYSKMIFKSVFFIFSLITMGSILSLLWNIVSSAIASPRNENTIAILITGAVSFLTTFISIPIAITQYLFNTKEDESMTEIIKNLQVYDSGIRNSWKDRKK